MGFLTETQIAQVTHVDLLPVRIPPAQGAHQVAVAIAQLLGRTVVAVPAVVAPVATVAQAVLPVPVVAVVSKFPIVMHQSFDSA